MTKSEIQSRLRAAIATISEITRIDERELTNIVTLAWYGRQAGEAGGYDPAIMTHLEDLIARRKRPEGHIEDQVDEDKSKDGGT